MKMTVEEFLQYLTSDEGSTTEDFDPRPSEFDNNAGELRAIYYRAYKGNYLELALDALKYANELKITLKD